MKEYRVSYKRDNGYLSHLRHRVFKKEETARKWFNFFSSQTKARVGNRLISPLYDDDDNHYEFIGPIIFGPRLQVREVGEWEDVDEV